MVDHERRLNPYLSGSPDLPDASTGARQFGWHSEDFDAEMSAARNAGSTVNHRPVQWRDPLAAEIGKRDDALVRACATKATELRASDPRLTPEGAFAKAYRMFPDLARRERQAARAALHSA